MSEIHLRLTDLRDAAGQLHRSHQRMAQSLTQIDAILQELAVLGMQEVNFQNAGCPSLAHMNDCLHDLKRLENQLIRTADDVEQAVHPQIRLLPHFDLSLLPQRTALVTFTSQMATIAAPENSVGYVASQNWGLFESFEAQQQELAQQHHHHADLLQQREALASELEATRNRALSYNPHLDIASIPRVQALNNELTQLDQTIAASNVRIGELDTSVQALHTRLLMVQPGGEADMQFVVEMQNAQTNVHVVNNTYDCVKHVVQKLPVPINMAHDAHLWNELALAHPEWGITVGDQPLEGAVMVLERDHSYADDVYGHLLYVEFIREGEVWVTDNLNPDPVRLLDIMDETTGERVSYLYFPWHTRA